MTQDSYNEETVARAADSGANASARFRERMDAQSAGGVVDTERVNHLASRAVKALNDIVLEEKVSYEEYNAFKAWLIRVGEDGEWPLFLDVWLEHSVEEVANEHREGSKGTIEGPYYLEDSPEVPWNGTIPMREDEPGTPFTFTGQVRAVDGSPLAGAKLELWHADDLGFYSQFAPGLPEWNLRATWTANEDGHFEIHTVRPAPYQIPTDGACGQLIEAAGWHAWRPAHMHFKVHAPGHHKLTAQLYFPGDEHLADDIASAVKPELMLNPQPNPDGEGEITHYDFVLDPEQ
ncbi:catechol 1,2-dioxygenase [Citricoccus sp. NPDC079358]|uniref:catechol 1,2-dioxygenase n=1 Tax=Citricoccus sp. NPDC079358 TaxID=3154653 RepID=UPI00344CD340